MAYFEALGAWVKRRPRDTKKFVESQFGSNSMMEFEAKISKKSTPALVGSDGGVTDLWRLKKKSCCV